MRNLEQVCGINKGTTNQRAFSLYHTSLSSVTINPRARDWSEKRVITINTPCMARHLHTIIYCVLNDSLLNVMSIHDDTVSSCQFSAEFTAPTLTF